MKMTYTLFSNSPRVHAFWYYASLREAQAHADELRRTQKPDQTIKILRIAEAGERADGGAWIS